MAQVRTVVYDMLEVVDTSPGGWCDRCMLGSGMRITLASQVRGRAMMLTTRTRCDECGDLLD